MVRGMIGDFRNSGTPIAATRLSRKKCKFPISLFSISTVNREEGSFPFFIRRGHKIKGRDFDCRDEIDGDSG